MKISREVKLGILAAVTLFLFIWGINYLRGKDLFTPQISFYAVYEEVGGLTESNPVRVSGVQIGQVDRIIFHPDGSGRVVVESIVESGKILIPENSTARMSSDFLGTTEIEIVLGDSQALLGQGDTLQSQTKESITDQVTRQLMPMRQKVEDLLGQVDTILTVIQYTFNPQTRDNIISSVESITKTLNSLESTTMTLDTSLEAQISKLSVILSNAESITTNIKTNNEDISRIIKNFSAISDTLAAARIEQTFSNVNQTMDDFAQVMEKINRGEGSMGLLINDEDLYRNLDASSRQLDSLLMEIRNNPGKYFNISVFSW
ncbi:MAG: MlaD family protein [Bacteroidales bacterium]